MTDFIKEYGDQLSIGFGLLIMVIPGIYVILMLKGIDLLTLPVNSIYASLFIFPLGAFLFLYGTYKSKLDKRREVDNSEIEALYAEVNRFPNAPAALLSIVQNEIIRLESLRSGDKILFELNILPLRQNLVALYPKEELISQSRYELGLLKEYAEDDDPSLYKEWKKRITDEIQIIVNIKNSRAIINQTINQLRANLIKLRETVAQYDKTWAEGEVIFKRVLYWAATTSLVALLIGILPIIYSLCDGKIGIFHWGALGVAGGLLSILVGIQDPSIPELGETKGKQVLHRTVLAIVIGGMTSILLYAALTSQILSGKMFPNISEVCGGKCYWLQTGGSVFWGIMAGFSMRIFVSLVGVAEGPFRKDESE